MRVFSYEEASSTAACFCFTAASTLAIAASCKVCICFVATRASSSVIDSSSSSVELFVIFRMRLTTVPRTFRTPMRAISPAAAHCLETSARDSAVIFGTGTLIVAPSTIWQDGGREGGREEIVPQGSAQWADASLN